MLEKAKKKNTRPLYNSGRDEFQDAIGFIKVEKKSKQAGRSSCPHTIVGNMNF